jgi:hypothetical protein
VALRDVEVGEAELAAACAALGARGFINYFGLQRFGSSSIPTHAPAPPALFSMMAVLLKISPRRDVSS